MSRRLCAILLLCAGCAFAGSLPVRAEQLVVAVVSGGDAEPYKLSEEGVRAELGAAGVRVVRAGPGASLSEEPRAIVALGANALRTARERWPDTPLVAGMVLAADLDAAGRGVTGVRMEFSATVQLQWMKKLLPGTKAVGLLYDPNFNEAFVEEARRAAARLGLELVERTVESPKELPSALKALGNRVDALWGIPDPIVLTSATARPLLTFAYANRLPVTGPSEAWTRAGATFSLDRDYEDVGRQCAEQVVKVLRGRDVESVEPESPRTIVYSVNQRAYEHNHLELSAEIEQAARTVYR